MKNKTLGISQNHGRIFRNSMAALLVPLFLAALLFSCDHDPNDKPVDEPPSTPEKKFWAQDMRDNTYYQLDAELLAENERCKVWVEKGSGVTAGDAQIMADAYKNTIYPKMTGAFAYTKNIQFGAGGPIRYGMNAMDIADYYGDGDGKLCILLLDIRDDYQAGVNDSFVGGYFSAIDMYDSASVADAGISAKTNECDMIYIDINPQVVGSLSSLATFAHEMQHMMNFAVTATGLERDSLMDTWVNEGLSSAAEWLVYDTLGEPHPRNRWGWYNGDYSSASGLIETGNNFFVWGNRGSENQYAVLDDYATVYLFFQWLRLQSNNSTAIYADILASKNYDHQAVTSAANSRMSGNNYSDWGILLKTWLAANYINAPSGRYGYMNDPVLSQVKARTAPAGTTSLQLYPGEGVYSVANSGSLSLPAATANIKYAGLSKTGTEQASDTNITAGGYQLTYNINTDIEGNRENGTTTGIAASVDIFNSGLSRSAAGPGGLALGPFQIGADDALRQNGRMPPPPPDLGKLRIIGTLSDE